MLNEVRTVCFDTELGIEAYNFKGIMQKFQITFTTIMLLDLLRMGRGICLAKISSTL